jgi:hypothetical protein
MATTIRRAVFAVALTLLMATALAGDYIAYLRKKVAAPGEPKLIRTVRGRATPWGERSPSCLSGGA